MRRAILVVAGEPDVYKTIAHTLHRTFDVLQSTQSDVALSLLRSRPVSAVLVDIRTPDIDGLSLLAAIRSEFPQVKRVLMTTFGNRTASADAICRAQIHGLISKPWTAGQLEQTIAEVMSEQADNESARPRLRELSETCRELKAALQSLCVEAQTNGR